MPSTLRSRVALVLLLGAFLIPIGMSSLRGLTHVLTCREQVETPFSLIVPEEGQPLVTTSTRLERGQKRSLCDGLRLNISAAISPSGAISMTVPIENRSDDEWRGTVELVLDGTSIPVDIGAIAPGRTESDTVELELDPGSHQLEGSLLIGP